MFRIKIIEQGSLSAKALKTMRRNVPAMVSLGVILVSVLIAVLGYLITPDSTPYANYHLLEISARKPGFKTLMLKRQLNEANSPCGFFRKMMTGCRSNYQWIPINSYRYFGNDILFTAFNDNPEDEPIVQRLPLTDVVFALPEDNGETVSHDLNGREVVFDAVRLRAEVESEHIVTKRYLLGTDRYGRDVLSQLMIGSRVSLSVGLISVAISLVLGIFLGAVAGFFRGWVDDVIVWFINVVWSLPTLLLVIAITFVLGKGFWQVFVAVGLTMWVEVARVVRGQFMSLREKEFVEAARAVGFKNMRIIARHILPNALGPVIVISAANFASAILIEAGLSFLGVGVQPPMPSWGTMVKENYPYIILDNVWLAILPGLAIMILVLAFMLIGNGLRDALDVKTNPVT